MKTFVYKDRLHGLDCLTELLKDAHRDIKPQGMDGFLRDVAQFRILMTGLHPFEHLRFVKR